jgi:hypothetical protein
MRELNLVVQNNPNQPRYFQSVSKLHQIKPALLSEPKNHFT